VIAIRGISPTTHFEALQDDDLPAEGIEARHDLHAVAIRGRATLLPCGLEQGDQGGTDEIACVLVDGF